MDERERASHVAREGIIYNYDTADLLPGEDYGAVVLVILFLMTNLMTQKSNETKEVKVWQIQIHLVPQVRQVLQHLALKPLLACMLRVRHQQHQQLS
ncbi:hypothetical protein AZI10_04775 [Levilactobacillus brevis]|nr:hypothetical protein AZI10_04775 [Levilactobacillus brevis]